MWTGFFFIIFALASNRRSRFACQRIVTPATTCWKDIRHSTPAGLLLSSILYRLFSNSFPWISSDLLTLSSSFARVCQNSHTLLGVGLLFKQTLLRCPHAVHAFLLVLLEDVALLAGTNLHGMIRCGIATKIFENAAEQFDVYGLSVWLNIFPFHHYNHFSIT